MPISTESNKWLLQQQLSNYIYFSPATTGKTGRAIKIHRDLFMPFFLAVNPKTHDGQLVIRTIESLKTMPKLSVKQPAPYAPSHAIRMVNLRDTFQHSLIIKNIQIYYRVDQEGDDKSPSVYINNLRIINSDRNQAPGLYEKKMLGDKIVKMTSKGLNGRHVYINSLINNTEKAYELAKDRSINEKDVKNLTLFYAPAAIANDLGIWHSPGQTQRTSMAVQELTEVLQHNLKSQVGVHWLVEGEGCALLNKALEGVKGELVNHTFKLINPRTNTPQLLQNITRKKGQLIGEFFNYSNDQAAYIALASHKQALIAQMGLLPQARNYDRITRQKITEQITALSNLEAPVAGQPAGLNANRQTFTQALNKAGIYRK